MNWAALALGLALGALMVSIITLILLFLTDGPLLDWVARVSRLDE